MTGIIKKIGWPRLIIGVFLFTLFILCPIVGVNYRFAINDVIGRFGMTLVLILSLVPMIQAGCGLNFGVPLGIVSGAFGAVCSIELQTTGFLGILTAMVIGCLFGTVIGLLYGYILNRIKGDEMIISTYLSMAFVGFMCMFWVKLLPFKNPVLIYAYGGNGMRPQVPLAGNWAGVLDNFLHFKIGSIIEIPVGMLLFGALCCFLMWVFFRSKLGTAMTAAGSNPEYARAAGVSIDKMRLVSVVMSTTIAAIGMAVYYQHYTFVQLYMTPALLMLPTVAAILIGGAGLKKATISNVLVGTFLFQGIVTVGPMVAGSAFGDIAEALRLVISNGMILYALTRKEHR
ncbi:MAG: ABC transporter permease [Clostridiales bacterium]|jgi:simple sugar transport system permease protein|nr:ABC transporter permease [Clostridiales bacterium]